MSTKMGVPVKGAWVSVNGELGIARRTRKNGSEVYLEIRLVTSGRHKWVNLLDVRGGFSTRYGSSGCAPITNAEIARGRCRPDDKENWNPRPSTGRLFGIRKAYLVAVRKTFDA